MRAWQSLGDGTHLLEPLQLTDDIVDLVVGGLRSGSTSSDRDAPPPRTRTVLELSATLSERPDAAQRAFRRAWRLAEDLSRAHAVASGCGSGPLALSDAFPISLFLTRDRRGWHRDSVSQYLIAENMDHVVPRGLEDENEINTFFVFARRLRSGDPWALYAERRAACRRAMLSGRFADAIIEAAVAAEIIFDAILGWALWEAGSTTADAATLLKRPLVERLRCEMHPRLGGKWDLENGPELSRWHSSVAHLRNRIVHRGYLPSEGEASEAVEAGDALESFLVDRVVANVSKFPRMAIAVLGEAGLKRRGLYSRRIDLVFRAAGPTGDIPLVDYQRWRASVDTLVREAG